MSNAIVCAVSNKTNLLLQAHQMNIIMSSKRKKGETNHGESLHVIHNDMQHKPDMRCSLMCLP